MTFEEFQKNTTLSTEYPYNLTLNLTNSCNLACRYCFVHQKPDFMSLDIAKKSIDFVYQNYLKHKNELKDINDQKINIVLFGGEPLLTFDTIIKPLFIYIESKYLLDNFIFNITTNGTLLTEEVCSFLQKYNINILISFDGMKQIQNNNRPFHDNSNSFDIILTNLLENVIKYNLNYELRATMDLDHINLWYDNFIFFNSLPIELFSYTIEYYKNLNDTQKKIAQQQIEKICYSIYLNIKKNNKIPKFKNYLNYINLICERDYNIILNNKIQPVYLNNFCGYNLLYITVDPYGNIYPCREEPARNIDNIQQCSTIIGNLDTGLDLTKLQNLRNQVNQIEYNFIKNRKCNQDCWLIENNFKCQYIGCPSHAIKEQTITIGNCEITSMFCQNIINNLYELIEKENNKFFIEYLRSNNYFFNFNYQYTHLIDPKLKQFLIEEEKKHNG